jgi:hypothetical protein
VLCENRVDYTLYKGLQYIYLIKFFTHFVKSDSSICLLKKKGDFKNLRNGLIHTLFKSFNCFVKWRGLRLQQRTEEETQLLDVRKWLSITN